MALRKSVPWIPSCLTWNNLGLGKAFLIFSSNDHRANSSTRRLSSNFLVPITAIQQNSLSLYWSPIPRRFRTSTNCILKSYPSIQAQWTLSKFWESVFAKLIKIFKYRQTPVPGTLPPGWILTTMTTESEPNFRYCLMGIERCLIGHFPNPKIWVTCSGSYLVS